MVALDPDYPDDSPQRPEPRRWPWNILLLMPMVALYPPIYNRLEPRLFGIPFFYWFLMSMILLSAACTFLVYQLTRTDQAVGNTDADQPDLLSVDALDEGVLDRGARAR